MKAIVCKAFAPVDQLTLEELPSRPLRAHEVRVRVRAAGVNFPDSLKVEGQHQIKPELPWVPGSETGGVVEEVGSGVTGVAVGDRVMGVSEATGGGFAQEIVLPQERVLHIPRSMSFEQAAAVPVVYGTTMYALKQRGKLQPGETLLVLGAAGGVGLATVQLGKAMGARVTDAGSGIDNKSVRLRIDGQDVSERARLRGDTVHFRDNLAPGRHTAELLVRDEAGNATRQAWDFRVVDRDQRAGRDLTLEVTSHRDNAVVDGDGRLVIEGRTLPGATVRVQVDSVTSLAGIIGFTQPVADQSVQADAQGRFTVRVMPRGLPIPGTRYEVELTATRGTQTAEESLTLYQRQG